MKRTRAGLASLLLVLLGTGVWLGFGDLRLERAQQARDPLTAAADYEAAARVLFWRRDLAEKAASAALQAEQPTQAIQLFEQARAQNGLSPAGQLQLGQAYLQTGAVEQAIREWQGLVNGGPASGEAAENLAKLHRERGETALEIWALRQWLAVEPTQADASERLGRLLAASAAPEALTWLKVAGSANPQAAARLERLVSALETPAPEPAYRLALCGQALAELGAWPLAESAFAQAVKVNPNYASAWAWLGLARQANGTAEAALALTTALRLEPNSAALHAMQGTYWLRTNQPAPARAEFERATQLEPTNPIWWQGLADAAAQSDLPAALAAYLQATQLAPKNPQTWAVLATFCVQNNIYLEEYGLEAARRAEALDPGQPFYLDLLGRAYLGLGQAAAAEPLFNQALAADPDGPTYIYHLHLGLLYLQTERQAQARAELEKTVQLNPQGAYGQQAKNLLERYFP
jgi:tetratricopeptide (TPR) repeat protein